MRHALKRRGQPSFYLRISGVNSDLQFGAVMPASYPSCIVMPQSYYYAKSDRLMLTEKVAHYVANGICRPALHRCRQHFTAAIADEYTADAGVLTSVELSCFCLQPIENGIVIDDIGTCIG